MKITLILVHCLLCFSFSSTASALYSPQFYEERAQQREDQRVQEKTAATVNVSQFKRGATLNAKGKPPSTVIEYVKQEEVELPPLQDTGPALNAIIACVLGASLGYTVYSRKKQLSI